MIAYIRYDVEGGGYNGGIQLWSLLRRKWMDTVTWRLFDECGIFSNIGSHGYKYSLLRRKHGVNILSKTCQQIPKTGLGRK